MASDIQCLIKWAIELGYTIEYTKKRHLKFVSPGGYAVFGSGTPSDHRAIDNIKGKLRRQLLLEAGGADVPTVRLHQPALGPLLSAKKNR